MHTVCLPSSVWRTEERAVQSFLSSVAGCDPAQPVFMLADASTVLRHREVVPAHHEVRTIEFAAWVRIGFTEDGVLDIERIRNDCAAFSAGSIVIVKACGFESELIVRALFQMRNGLFLVARWPHVVAVICDDPQVFQVTPTLSSTFYLQPDIFNPAATRRVAAQMIRDSNSLRLLGKNMGALPILLRRWSLLRRKARERRMKRELGWVWEE